MKQNKNLVSSLLVALLAGFIYYQLGGVEDIKKIAAFGYSLIGNPIHEVASAKVAANGKLNELNITKKEANNDFITPEKNQFDLEQSMKELAVYDITGRYVTTNPDDQYKIDISTNANSFLTNEGDFAVNIEYFIPKISNVYKNNFKNIRTHNNNKCVDVIASVEDFYKVSTPVKICDDDDPITVIVDDSNFIKLDIEKLELDKFNVKLEGAMEKLNIAIGKLSDSLKDMDFNFDNEENKAEFKLKMKEFEEDMKEFEIEMKKLDFEYNEEMKEFKEDMKEFKEDMKEFKKELKENLKERKREKYIEKDIDS